LMEQNLDESNRALNVTSNVLMPVQTDDEEADKLNFVKEIDFFHQARIQQFDKTSGKEEYVGLPAPSLKPASKSVFLDNRPKDNNNKKDSRKPSFDSPKRKAKDLRKKFTDRARKNQSMIQEPSSPSKKEFKRK